MNIVVVPTYNEKENIAALLAEVWKHSSALHILVVDDGSPDGTAAVVKEMQKHHGEQLHLLQRPGKQGLGAAYVAGFKWALERGYEKIVEMDADFSHDPKYLPSVIAGLETSDIVVGSRYIQGGGVENWSLFRQLISRAGSLYARTILGFSVWDFTGGFNGWRATVLKRINMDTISSQGYSFQIELKYRALKLGCSLAELPITFVERRAGSSKMSLHIVIEAIYKVWHLRFRKSDF